MRLSEPLVASTASRSASESSLRAFARQRRVLLRSIDSDFCAAACVEAALSTLDRCLYAALVTMSLCSDLIEPRMSSRNVAASQSRSSGCVGLAPMRPKSFGVSAIARPK